FVTSPHAHPKVWIYISGLDGTPRDSIGVPLIGHGLQGVGNVPGSKWIVVRFEDGESSVWVAIDRLGREHSRAVTPIAQNMWTSADAVWMRFRSGGAAEQPIVARLPFDSKGGRFAGRLDTVYRLGARDNDFSVTDDGGTLMFGEGIAEFDVFA